jgi:tRNA 2-thiocytidine biosynthesis protein TtcA
MLREWDRKSPGRVQNIFRSLQNIAPSHLMDSKLYDFQNISANGVPNPTGDKLFDDEDFKVASSLDMIGIKLDGRVESHKLTDLNT